MLLRLKKPKNVVVGFTGTQQGMSAEQFEAVHDLLDSLKPIEAHHGDCIGADSDFHIIAVGLRIPVVIHPPKDSKKRAFCYRLIHDPEFHNIRQEKPQPYLVRNRLIVDACSWLIATPREFEEQLRSGTWSTVRYAEQVKKRITIIFPNGATEEIYE